MITAEDKIPVEHLDRLPIDLQLLILQAELDCNDATIRATEADITYHKLCGSAYAALIATAKLETKN